MKKNIIILAGLLLLVTAVGLVFTLKEASAAGKDVEDCVEYAPTVIISPSSQTGTPGATKYYGITVTNNYVGSTCGIRQFNLFEANPGSGWTSSINPTTLNLGNSGNITTGYATYTLTSPSNAQPGSYPFVIAAYETIQTPVGSAVGYYNI